MRQRAKLDIEPAAPVVDIPPMDPETALNVLVSAGAARWRRYTNRCGFVIRDEATGETDRGAGLVIVINEKMLRQGWK